MYKNVALEILFWKYVEWFFFEPFDAFYFDKNVNYFAILQKDPRMVDMMMLWLTIVT